MRLENLYYSSGSRKKEKELVVVKGLVKEEPLQEAIREQNLGQDFQKK